MAYYIDLNHYIWIMRGVRAPSGGFTHLSQAPVSHKTGLVLPMNLYLIYFYDLCERFFIIIIIVEEMLRFLSLKWKSPLSLGGNDAYPIRLGIGASNGFKRLVCAIGNILQVSWLQLGTKITGIVMEVCKSRAAILGWVL